MKTMTLIGLSNAGNRKHCIMQNRFWINNFEFSLNNSYIIIEKFEPMPCSFAIAKHAEIQDLHLRDDNQMKLLCFSYC